MRFGREHINDVPFFRRTDLIAADVAARAGRHEKSRAPEIAFVKRNRGSARYGKLTW